MSDKFWATVVVPNMQETRALARFTEGSAPAIKWCEEQEIKDYTVVQAGTRMSVFSHYELDALMRQFGDPRQGLKKDQKEAVVRSYLSQFDPARHGPDGLALTGAYYQTGTTINGGAPGAAAEEDVQTQTSGRKKKAAAPPKGKAKQAAPKKRKGLADQGDGLGRPGTPARFIRERLAKGEAVEKIFEAAKKQFPKMAINNTGYVTWYRRDMEKRGLLKATKH